MNFTKMPPSRRFDNSCFINRRPRISKFQRFNINIVRFFKRKMKLTKKQRVIRNTLILGITILIISSSIINKFRISGDTAFALPDNLEEVVVTIYPGDRAWNIQKELAPNGDVRELLYYANIVNGKSVGDIRPGEQIIFFKIIED